MPSILADFNQIWILSTDFYKRPSFKVSRKSVQWKPRSRIRRDGRTEKQKNGRTDMRKLVGVFATIPTRPKTEKNTLLLRITLHRFLYLQIWPREHFHSQSLNSHFLLHNDGYSSLSESLRHCLFSVHLNTLSFSHMCSIAYTDCLQESEYSLGKYFLKFPPLCGS